MIRIQFKEDTKKIDSREKCLEYLHKHKVDVGLTSTASGRSKFLLGIHTRGSPIMRIPPRPVVDPALHQEGLQQETLARFLGAEEEVLAEGLSKRSEAAVSGKGKHGISVTLPGGAGDIGEISPCRITGVKNNTLIAERR